MNIEDYFLKQRKVRPSTARNYMTILKKLNNNKPVKDLDFLKNYLNVFMYIKKLALSTQRTYIAVVIQALKSRMDMEEEKDIYEDKHNELDFMFNENTKYYQKNEKEKERMCSMEELKLCCNYWLDLIDEIIYNEKHHSKIHEIYRNAIISLLYTEIPAIRLDYATMEIIYDANEMELGKNYLLIEPNEKSFILQHYKTSKKYNEKVFHPTTLLSNIIDEWVKLNDSKYLFPNITNDAPLTTNFFGKLIPKVFEPIGKKITINIIRHIWISENVDHKVLDKNAELASFMMHSPATQKNYIRI